MFNSFKRKLPEISIFHHPSSPPSNKALALLKNSLQSPYPPTNPTNAPLAFELSIVENPPTEDQLRTIMTFIPRGANPGMTFLSAFPGVDASGVGGGSGVDGSSHGGSIKDIVHLAQKNPKALKYPIVVDWGNGHASVGDVEGVKKMLEDIRQRRDGEKKDGDEPDQPKGWFS